MRGNPASGHPERLCARSIPAYAGEPSARGESGGTGRVYPRVCGGTFAQSLYLLAMRGLSPRMRGNRSPRSPLSPLSPLSPGLSPRMRGNRLPPKKRWAGSGLSPRMRGNQPRSSSRWGQSGSIPAYAGEPSPQHGARCLSMVYPRVCGGTAPAISPKSSAWGLSPRMRGNPTAAGDNSDAPRSIPAYAGEPPTSSASALSS